MGMDSQTIQTPYIIRGATEPGRKVDGMLWVNPQGGANGNNNERYYYDIDTANWLLIQSVGPDTPLYPAEGANWTDTGNGTVKNYRSNAWQNVGVTDHANLSNVTANQHHSKPSFISVSGSDSHSIGQTDSNITDSFTFTPTIGTNMPVGFEVYAEVTPTGGGYATGESASTDVSVYLINPNTSERTGVASTGASQAGDSTATAATTDYATAFNTNDYMGPNVSVEVDVSYSVDSAYDSPGSAFGASFSSNWTVYMVDLA